MKLTPTQWSVLLARCGVRSDITALWSDIFSEVLDDQSFSKGTDELAPFLGNVLHESMRLTRMEENLNYTARRIREVGFGFGPGTRWRKAAEQAEYLAGNPEALAEVLYGGRNGNNYPGDGWRFRGRGPIGLTFSDNYLLVGSLIGQDLTSNPDLAAQPRYSLEIALAWWEDRVPDEVVGNDGLTRRVVNGGKIGLDDVIVITREARAAIQELTS